MHNIILIGFLVEDGYFEANSRLDKNPQVAARKLESAYLDGFVGNNISVRAISFFPASTYPSNRKIFFGFRNWAFNRWRLPFINFPGLKMFTKMLSCLVSGLVLNFRDGHVDALCVYSLHSPYLLAALMISSVLRIKFFVIVPDLPTMMRVGQDQNKVICFMKMVDNWLINFCLRYASGFSVVTRDMMDILPSNIDSKFVVIEGLSSLPPPSSIAKCLSPMDRRYFLYSGGLSEAYGVGNLVRAFVSTDCNVDLVLCGTGPLEEWITELANHDKRIRFLGFIDQERLASLQAGAIALMLTRKPDSEFVKYSFPSKLIEYMNTAVPVVCTRLPCIPEEYFKYLLVIEDNEVSTISRVCQRLADHVPDEFARAAQMGAKYIRDRTNPQLRVAELVKIMIPAVDREKVVSDV